MQFTINLPETIAIESRGVVVDFDLSRVATTLVERAVIHGFGQKIADAASGAVKLAGDGGDVEAVTESLMAKAIAALYEGTWKASRTGSGAVDPVLHEARLIMRKAIKDQMNKGGKKGAPTPAWAAFTGLSDDEQLAKVDANLEANRAAIWPIAEAEAKRKADERKAKAALKAGLSVTITL